MASQDQGSPPPPSNPQSDIVDGDTTNPQPSFHAADDFSSGLAPGGPDVNGPVNGDTTNPQPASHATGGLPLNVALGNPSGNGPTMTWNQFDQALLDGQQRENTLQNSEVANFMAALSRALPSSPVYYAGDDGLQAYLIRQQICAGIPLDQIEPMNGPGARRRARMETRGPVFVEISDRGANVPMIPPARFNGTLRPLPLHPWLPYPEGYPQAQATSEASENAAGNSMNEQSQEDTMAIDNTEEQDDLVEPLANEDHETDSQEDTGSQQSESNTALENYPQDTGPISDHSSQPASHNGVQLNGDIDMMGTGLAGNPGVITGENMAPPTPNSRQPFNGQTIVGTNAHISNTQPMIGSSAYFNNFQPMMGKNPPSHAQSNWMNNPGINQATSFQDPNHITHGSNPSLWAFNNQTVPNYVSQGPFPATTGNSLNNPFQNPGTNNGSPNGFPLNNGTMNPYASYQSMLGNNQAGAARFTNGVTERNVQYTLSNAVRSMTDYFDRVPLPPRPNNSSLDSETSNELAIFFDTEEEQQTVTNFYLNHFAGPHGA